jgi:hypothetical protein
MATTSNTYTGNGSNRLFSITFPYLNTTDIDVYLNGALQTVTTQYTFANATTVEFVTAPSNGATVLLRRSTDDAILAATFFAGSSIRAADLNDNFDQVLYIAQETNNNVANAVAGQIPDGTITNVKLAADSVASSNIIDGTIVNADVNASAGIVATKLAFTQAGTGAVARTVDSKLKDVVSVKDFGAVGDGVVNDTAAFVAANTAVGSGGQLVVPPGTYKITADTTLTSVLVLSPGAIIKPATGAHVNLSKKPIAGLHQIFDRSGGGVVQFIGGGIPEVYAEWWGARGGTGGRTDNEVPIQYALDAVQSIVYGDFTTKAPNDDNSGGVVVLGYAADYLLSNGILLRNRARIRGQGRYSELKINNATWGGDTTLINSVNGISSQFWCRLEDLTVNANENTVITKVIYAPAWQESCGLRDVLILNFRCHGVYIDNGYGGSVGACLKQVQFFPSASIASSRAAIYIDVPYTVGVYNLLLEEISFAGWLTGSFPAIGLTGVLAKGRVRIQCRGVHIEGFDYGIQLDTNASLYGILSAGGNASVDDVIACNSTWTGHIDCPTINKGGAVHLVHNYAATVTDIYKTVEPVFKRVVYPHTPSEVVAYCRNTAAGGTLDSTAFGFTSIAKTGTGQYTLTFDATKFAPNGGTAFRTKVEIGSTAGRTYYVNGQTATTVLLVFKDLANAVADCDFFDVFIYGRPGY